MSVVLLRRLCLCLLLCFFTGVVRTQDFVGAEPAFVPFPTRFRIQDRSPNVVISEDLRKGLGPFNIITGDFNGDQIDDLLVTNSSADGSVQQTGRASVILGNRPWALLAVLTLPLINPT